MLIGGGLMVILVVAFQKGITKQKVVVREETRIVTTKSKPKQMVRESRPLQAQQTRKIDAQIPAPDLGLIIGGIAMNIPEFTPAPLVTEATDLLDDIGDNTVMTEDTVDSKPRITNRPPMEFPKSAAKEGTTGFVVVNLLIGEDGNVELVRIVDSQPQGVFDNIVMTGIRNWNFSPATYKGKPVKVWAKQKVTFKS